MSTLAAAADDYLRVRRALGYKLDRQGRQLLQFVAYLDRSGATTVTIEHAIGWATLPLELVTERAPDPQIIVRRRRERAHVPAPASGHGRARTRSPVRSTFA